MKRITVNMLSIADSVKGQGVETAYNELINLLSKYGKDDLEIVKNKGLNYDVLHMHTVNVFSYIKQRLTKGVTLTYVHFLPDTLVGALRIPQVFMKIYAWWVRRCYLKSDYLVVVNPDYPEEMVKMGFDEDRIFYIPNYVSEESFFVLPEKDRQDFRKQYGYKEDDFIIALELLTAVARKNTVDEETLNGGLENILNVMPYRAITENTGICQEMAGEYIYYLLQCGINATTCSALSRDREFSHMWALVEIEGEYYHADPMMSVDYPNSPAFFGMNDTIRDQYGDFDPEEFTYAESGVFTHEDFVCNSERFKRLWRAESYRILHNERKLELTLFDVYAPETEDEFLY